MSEPIDAPHVNEKCGKHLNHLLSQSTQAKDMVKSILNDTKTMDIIKGVLKDTKDVCGTDVLNHYLNDVGAKTINMVIDANTSTSNTTAINDRRKSITTMAIDDSNYSQSPQDLNTIRAETIAMNMQKATEEMESAIRSLRSSANNYQTAMQLEKTGEHVGNVQLEVSKHNQQILAQLASDTMTAKRVATINQQNTLHVNIVAGYMQLCSIFLAVGIVIMFFFSIPIVRSFFAHPYVLMQSLLVILFVILAIIIIYRVVSNDNHYWMLHQERVFTDPSQYEKAFKPKCPDTTPPPDISTVMSGQDVVQDSNESCDV